MKTVLTYGTFDLLHYGHINLLRRAKMLGDRLIVALSTDDFNKVKGKISIHNFDTRKEILDAIKYIDLIIPERSWAQKPDDIKRYGVDIVVMGDDWKDSDMFMHLDGLCQLVFLERTEQISTTLIKENLPRYRKGGG